MTLNKESSRKHGVNSAFADALLFEAGSFTYSCQKCVKKYSAVSGLVPPDTLVSVIFPAAGGRVIGR
jgi:hypothetical protein